MRYDTLMMTEPIATIDPADRIIVADHYQIENEQPIGSGGMALVYAGRDLRTRRAVALKTLKPEWVNDAAARARFRHEARTMAFLAHPNVARVYDLWEPDDASQPWVVLELLDGPSLREALAESGPMDLDVVAHLLKQIASALDHLHSRGLCHLDIKPGNILFAEPMKVKLIDFGIAQPTGSATRPDEGPAFGSVAYISPEQAAGERIGPASDTYSLGCVVYEMVTGTPPFVYPAETDPQVVLAAHLTEEIDPPTERAPDLGLPNWIDDIILDALLRDPERRYRTSTAFADAFRGAMEAETPPDSTVPLNHLPRFDPRANPTVVFAEQPIVRARRTRPPRVSTMRTGWIWKLVLIMILANVLLAALLLATRGTIPGLYEPETPLSIGVHVEITTDFLNIRAAPDSNAAVLGQLNPTDDIRVTGLPDNGWLPVEVERNGQQITGFVSVEFIKTLPMSGIDRLRNRIEQVLP
jgi:serine/threonine-protein kinase